MRDCLIIGAGPAGLSAAIYAARAQRDTLVLEKEIAGGQITTTEKVENYPGINPEDTGISLSERMKEQAESFGAEFAKDEIVSLELEGKVKRAIGKKGTYEAKTIFLGMGATPRKLDIEGEQAFTGRGVGYCATCDAPFFQDLEVYVIGGGDSALEEGLYLTRFARKVHIINRSDTLKASAHFIKRAQKNEKIEIVYHTELIKIEGDFAVSKLTFRNNQTGEVYQVEKKEEDPMLGVFIFIGMIPQTDLVKGQLNTDNGYIVTDEHMKTNLSGVYAIGDIRKKQLRQVVTATADGAIAAFTANEYLDNL